MKTFEQLKKQLAKRLAKYMEKDDVRTIAHVAEGFDKERVDKDFYKIKHKLAKTVEKVITHADAAHVYKGLGVLKFGKSTKTSPVYNCDETYIGFTQDGDAMAKAGRGFFKETIGDMPDDDLMDFASRINDIFPR